MKKSLNVSIPKPCGEDWSKMTPNEKGRFCNSCSKTVVDFTKKSISEIQEILLENRYKKLCGKFYKKQLDSITIEIPEDVFYQQLSFSKLFLLVLLITMGTTLFSCSSDKGTKQQIDNIVLVDSVKKIEKQVDTIKLNSTRNFTLTKSNLTQKETSKNNNTGMIEEEVPMVGIMIMGDMVEDDGDKEEILFGMINEEPPKFWGTKGGSIEELKKSFSDSIANFVNVHFDVDKTKSLGLNKGKQKIWAQFTINEDGNIINLRARASHKELESQAIELLKKLPQLVPAKQRGKPIKINYTVPIIFDVE